MAYIGRYDDDYAKDAIAVTASAEVSAYGAVQLIGENAALPAKLSTTTGNFVLQFDGEIEPAYAMLTYHYLDAGLSGVKIQANDSNSWGSPAFEQAFTIPAKRLDGPSYQRWTNNAIIALADLDYGGFEWWRLVFEDANSQNIVVGRLLLLSQLRQVDVLHVDGAAFDEDDQTFEINPQTDLGVDSGVTPMGGPRRSFAGLLVCTDLDAGTAPIQEAADFRALHETSEGRAHPFVFIKGPALDDPWHVKFETNQSQRTHRQGGYQVWPFAVRETSRGLPWP
jgi:hypothetical protein